MTDFKALLRILSEAGVDCIIIGGVAAAVHGAARATFDLDILGEIVGGGGYDALLPSTVVIRAFGVDCRLLNLDRLIEVKRAAGRPKDFEAIAELETVRARQQQPRPR